MCRGLLFFFTFCLLAGCKKNQKAVELEQEPPGFSLQYVCSDSLWVSDKNSSSWLDVYLTWLARDAKKGVSTILVSDAKFLSSPTAAVIVFDEQLQRVDQIRSRDNRPLTFDAEFRELASEQALQYIYSRLGLLLLEMAPRALQREFASPPLKFSGENKNNSFSQISIMFENYQIFINTQDYLSGIFSYKAFPKLIENNLGNVCKYIKTHQKN